MNLFRNICIVIIVVGLAWIFTLFYGGPLTPFFAWLAQQLPHGSPLNLNPAPLNH